MGDAVQPSVSTKPTLHRIEGSWLESSRRVLTDYHVHLRPDDEGTTAAEYFTAANAERYRTVAEERGIAELGVAEHIHRFTASLDIWRTRGGSAGRATTSTSTASFVREETDLRLGIEADFVSGREDRIANFLDAREWDYVVGSVHFVADEAVDMEDFSVWGRGESPEKVWKRYFETRRRGGPHRHVRHHGPPRPGQGVGRRRAAARAATCAATTSRAIEGFLDGGVAVEVSTAGLRKPVGEIYPARGFLEEAVGAGLPIALSSDAHVPDQLGFRYEDGAGAARAGRRDRDLRVRGPRAAARAGRLMRTGIGIDSHRFEDGRPLILGGVEIPGERGLAGHSDADVLTHAIVDALLGAAGLGDIGQHFPDTDELWRDADSMALLRDRRSSASPPRAGRSTTSTRR